MTRKEFTEASLEKLREWSDHNTTRTNRFLGLMDRHTNNLAKWVDSFGYPVSSPEFSSKTIVLWLEVTQLLDEYKECFGDMANDVSELQEVLETFRKEVKHE